MTARMKTWRCPKCHDEQLTIGTVEGHRCPSNQSKWTRYELVEEKVDA